MSDNRAIVIYNRLAERQAQLVQTQARMISIANSVFATGPVGAQKATELIASAVAVGVLNTNLIAAMNSIIQKRNLSEVLSDNLDSSNLSGNTSRQTIYGEFGDQIAAIGVQMAEFVVLRDIARQSSTQITAVAQQSKLSTDSEFAVGKITGIVGVAPLPPPGGAPPPPPPAVPPAITPATSPPAPPAVAPPKLPPKLPPRGPGIVLE